MLKIKEQALIKNSSLSILNLYEKHAGMLLGYFFEVVKDRTLAEEYLVKTFCDLSEHFNEIDWSGTNSWCQLQRFAKGRLTAFNRYREQAEMVSDDVDETYKDNLIGLNDEQKQVFCDIYYRGKDIAVISVELNKTEDLIRKTLKEAFAIIRKSGENKRIH